MEKLLQYLDDVDDLIGMIGLVAERIRGVFLALAFCLSTAGITLLGVTLALASPPLALATSVILFVTLLYRFVTAPPSVRPHSP